MSFDPPSGSDAPPPSPAAQRSSAASLTARAPSRRRRRAAWRAPSGSGAVRMRGEVARQFAGPRRHGSRDRRRPCGARTRDRRRSAQTRHSGSPAHARRRHKQLRCPRRPPWARWPVARCAAMARLSIAVTTPSAGAGHLEAQAAPPLARVLSKGWRPCRCRSCLVWPARLVPSDVVRSRPSLPRTSSNSITRPARRSAFCAGPEGPSGSLRSTSHRRAPPAPGRCCGPMGWLCPSVITTSI